MSTHDIPTFDIAVQYIINGDKEQLANMLKEHPTLINERSPEAHNATLLHYVAANGVEDELQKSPPNAAEIASVLLKAGANVNALANCYGGGPAQTTLSLLVSSYHPFNAGVQVPVARALIDAGAKINGISNEGGPIATAIAFGYTEVALELAGLGAQIYCIQVAAALGVQKMVEQFFDSDGTLVRDAGVNDSGIIPSTTDSQQALDSAVLYACLHQQHAIADFLLSKGATLNAKGSEGFTALHSAAVKGDIETLKFLLSRNAPTEVTNNYGGTPLDTLCWFANNVKSAAVDYVSVAAILIEHGASTSAISPYPTGHDELDKLIKGFRE